jgi:hypothetical protein
MAIPTGMAAGLPAGEQLCRLCIELHRPCPTCAPCLSYSSEMFIFAGGGSLLLTGGGLSAPTGGESPGCLLSPVTAARSLHGVPEASHPAYRRREDSRERRRPDSALRASRTDHLRQNDSRGRERDGGRDVRDRAREPDWERSRDRERERGRDRARDGERDRGRNRDGDRGRDRDGDRHRRGDDRRQEREEEPVSGYSLFQ